MTRIRHLVPLLLVLTTAAAQSSRPVPIDSVLATVDYDYFAGATPSPDGRFFAYDVITPGRGLKFEYDSQIFTRDGYPYCYGLALARAHLVDRDKGSTSPLSSPEGTSWSGSWSPDGRQFAFYSNRSGMSAVWIWDAASGTTRQVKTDAVPHIFRMTERPMWTPDGREVVFKAVPEGMTLLDKHRMNPDFVRRERDTRATRDPNAVMVHVHRASEKKSETAAEAGWIAYRYLTDLVAVDVASGKTRRIARRVHPICYAVSPDGKWVGSIDIFGRRENTQQLLRSFTLYPLAGGPEVRVADRVIMSDPSLFSWSPDGSKLAYVVHEDGRSDSTSIHRCRVFDVATRREMYVSNGIPGRPRLSRTAPLWSADGSSLWLVDSALDGNSSQGSKVGFLWRVPVNGGGAARVVLPDGVSVQEVVSSSPGELWSPDSGRSLVAVTRDDRTKRQAFLRIDTRTLQAESLAEFDASINRYPRGGSKDPRHFAFIREDAQTPGEIHLFDMETRQARRVSQFSAAFTNSRRGTVRLVDWLSLDGEKLQGSLLLPADYQEGTKYPLFVWVYGGSYGSDKLNAFNFATSEVFNFQVLASRGYAVLFPDVPLRRNSPMRDVAAAVLPGVNRIVELGIADPDRLVVSGQSFGGYNTISLITQTTRFRAAIANASGAADMFEGYSRFSGTGGDKVGYYEVGQGGMGGHPWEVPERYLENSPFFFLDRVQTPLLLQRGLRDEIAEANGSVYVGLKRLGKKVEFLEYENEGHVLQMPQHIVDYWHRRLAFLQEHLDLVTDADGAILFQDGRAVSGRSRSAD
jgi:dipeptidyl aminopeptidase/acylaminoacyl peptidase